MPLCVLIKKACDAYKNMWMLLGASYIMFFIDFTNTGDGNELYIGIFNLTPYNKNCATKLSISNTNI